MALSLAQLLDDVNHVLGKDADALVDATQVVNEAGRLLFQLHAWQWRNRPVADLDLVADQAYVALPADFGFGEVDDLNMSDALSFGIAPSTLSEIEYMRSQQLASPAMYFWALAYPSQTSTTAAPGQPRIELHPTPSSSEADAIKLTYRAGWVELSDNASVANVPVSMEHLLRRIVRAYAVAYHTGDYAALDSIEASPEFKRLKKADGGTQRNLGKPMGGMLRGDRRFGHEWNFTTTHPS